MAGYHQPYDNSNLERLVNDLLDLLGVLPRFESIQGGRERNIIEIVDLLKKMLLRVTVYNQISMLDLTSLKKEGY
jgi:hypothetical protein